MCFYDQLDHNGNGGCDFLLTVRRDKGDNYAQYVNLLNAIKNFNIA